jgi:YVTN family beta-propeller protein
VNGIGHNVSVIDTATNTVSATIPGVLPLDIAITPDGAFVFLTTFADFVSDIITVTVIDTATNTVIAAIPVGVGGGNIAITPDGAFVYVVQDPDLNLISVIDIATRSVVATVSIAAPFAPVGPFGIAIRPDGAFAYVTNLRSDTVSVIDTTTNTVIATIPVGDRPTDIAFAPRVHTDPIGSLIAQVQTLIAGGTLTADQGAGLMDKLQQVQSKIDNGETAAACNQLSAFTRQVNAFLNSGSLTTSQGQALINAANAIKTSLGC